MIIQITGASGFVGQNLTQYFAKSPYKITALSLRSENCKKDLDQDADAIIHLAGKAHDTKNTSDESEYFKVNRDLTIALFEQFLQSNIRDFFYFSSVKAVADMADNVVDENITPNPLTAYGKSKFEAEQFLLSQTLPTGKRLFIIRPCMIHGAGNKGNLNLLYKVVEKGIPWPLASFHNQRSFLSIDNLNFLIEQMLLKDNLASGVYHFADDETLSTNELIILMSETLGKKTKLWSIPAGLIKLSAKIGDVLHLPLNSERLKKLTESYVVSNQKIKQALGIEKLPITAKQGLEKTIWSFKARGTES
ncbi:MULTISPECIES: NAD-dependent epimerase/dehydratase family protein [unclassified Lonepinella]|uniref:NAD-dependent epimerase/dehydratase family protein n=1 Tax=unclassified Lonepinella TaxID=2642006 RepID=UPI0036D8D417